MTKTNAIDFHDAIAVVFNDKYESSRAFLERFQIWTALFEHYIKASDHIMDLGCGSGIFSNYLANKGCTVTGIDGSAAMITLCNQQKRSANVQYVVASLPLPNLAHYAPQDIILMSSFLEYIDDSQGMLEQAKDLLKPSGLLIVSIPNPMSLYRKLERMLFWLTGRPLYFAYSQHTISEMLFKRCLATLGFEALETIYFSGHDPISRILKPFLADCYVNNLLVGVYRKRPFEGN